MTISDRQGSVTIKLLLVLSAMVLLTVFLVEAGRLRTAEAQVSRAADLALLSALAAYDGEVKEEYGLFFCYANGRLEQETSDILQRNLTPGAETAGWTPCGYRVEDFALEPQFLLTDPEAVRHQILEYMKYRGPERLSREVGQKLKAFWGAQRESVYLAKGQALDRGFLEYQMQCNALAEALQPLTEHTDAAHGDLCRGLQSEEESVREEAEEALSRLMQRTEAALQEADRVLACESVLEKLLDQSEATGLEPDAQGSDQAGRLLEKCRGYRARLATYSVNAIETKLSANLGVLQRLEEGSDGDGYTPVRAGDLQMDAAGAAGRAPGGSGGLRELARLLELVREQWDGVRRSFGTNDRAPVIRCPGRGELPGSVVGPVDPEGLLEDCQDRIQANGEVKAPRNLSEDPMAYPKTLYEQLLISEYVLSVFNHRTSPEHRGRALQESEVEYVLAGYRNPEANAAAVQLELVAWRTLFNTLALSGGCPEAERVMETAAYGLEALTGVPKDTWQGVLTGIAALMEGLEDGRRLTEGESVPLLKRKLEDFTCLGAFARLTEEEPLPAAEATSSETPTIEVNYQDHLRIMLMTRMLSGKEQLLLERIQDLIHTNLSGSRPGYDPERHASFLTIRVDAAVDSIRSGFDGIRTRPGILPRRHQVTVECSRGY